MPQSGEHVIGGPGGERPLGETSVISGGDAPDGATGPEDRVIPELIELADSPEGRRIEQKLRAEALARGRGGDEDSAVEDPSGHA